MQTEIKIKTADKKTIYGTFVPGDKKAEKLVVFVHGFTGNQNEHIFFNGAKFFSSNGFDTFRFNLYAGGKGSRNFRDTKISLHGQDISTVVKYFRKKYQKIFVVGHSYGGTSLLFTDQSLVDGFVFWDASYITSKDASAQMKYNKVLDEYILDWGIEIIVGKSFVEELKNFPDCGKLIKQINKPVLFISAGEKGNAKPGEKYFKQANNPKKLVNLKTATHCFDDFKDEEKLFEETFSFLRDL